MRRVPDCDWLAEVAALGEPGRLAFDWLGCVDDIGRSESLRVIVSLRDLEHPERPELMLATELDRNAAQLDSLRGLYRGAAWHEREAAELFGVTFRGGDSRPLLTTGEFAGAAMRKDEVLGARAGQPWPGAKEPGETTAAAGRRRMVPPGVPDAEVWGDRDAADPPAEPAEVAAAVVGGRVRRRRT